MSLGRLNSGQILHAYVKSQHKDDKSLLKEAWRGLCDPLQILMPPMISQEWLKLEAKKFARKQCVSNPSLR